MRNILVTGGAGFIGSNLAIALQNKYPDARIVIVDDFRSGDFKNLTGYRGDFMAVDISRLDWSEKFKDTIFDAIFHLASITDTTVHDQRLQTHDNVEGFRRLLRFAAPDQTPVVYASSAAVYGVNARIMKEDQAPEPANAYAFSKVQLDNLAAYYSQRHSAWRIVGLRYFNVYGPNESHKKSAASMIYQLYCQMKSGKRPRVFKSGDQKRDFVFVEDVVAMTLQAVSAPQSGVYNCGSGHAFSFNEIIQELNRNLNLSLEPEYFENPFSFYQPYTQADMTRAKKDLGHTPLHPPEKGIAEYVSALNGTS